MSAAVHPPVMDAKKATAAPTTAHAGTTTAAKPTTTRPSMVRAAATTAAAPKAPTASPTKAAPGHPPAAVAARTTKTPVTATRTPATAVKPPSVPAPRAAVKPAGAGATDAAHKDADAIAKKPVTATAIRAKAPATAIKTTATASTAASAEPKAIVAARAKASSPRSGAVDAHKPAVVAGRTAAKVALPPPVPTTSHTTHTAHTIPVTAAPVTHPEEEVVVTKAALAAVEQAAVKPVTTIAATPAAPKLQERTTSINTTTSSGVPGSVMSPDGRSMTRGAEGLTKRDVMAIFREFDADGNGTIEPSEFQDFLFALGEVKSIVEVDNVFKRIDTDGSGALDFEEFYKWFLSEERNASGSNVSSLVKIKLRNRFLARKAKQVEEAIKEAAKELSNSTFNTEDLNKVHVKLGVGKVQESAPFGVLLKLTHNDGAALDELFASSSAQFAGMNVNEEEDEDEEKPKERPKSAIYATFTVSEDANDMDLNEWCNMLNCIVSAAASSEEGKDGLIPAYAGFRADVTCVDGERLMIMKLFFKEDPFSALLEHLSGQEGSKLSQVVNSCIIALRSSMDFKDLVCGKVTKDLAADFDIMLQVQRRAVEVGAHAAHTMAKRWERVCRDLDSYGQKSGDAADGAEYEDDTELYPELETTTGPSHRPARSTFSISTPSGAGAFFAGGDGDPSEGGWAQSELKKLRSIAAAVEALRSTEELNLKLNFETFAKMVQNLKYLPQLQSYGGGLLSKLARTLLNPHSRRQAAIQWLNDWLGSVDPTLVDFFQQAKLSLKSFNRIALQTGDALISVDMTGMLLQPLWELERQAAAEERNILMIGPSRAGKTRILNYLVGTNVNPTPERGRVTAVVQTDSHNLRVTEFRGLVAGANGCNLADAASSIEEPIHGIIMVVDARKSRSAALEEAKEYFEELMLSGFTSGKPLLVLASKADIPGEKFTAEELKVYFTHPNVNVSFVSGATGSAVDEGIAWLCDQL